MTPTQWLEAVPGLASIVAVLVGYGMLLNRVKNVEADVATMQKELAELRATRETVARIDERTKFTQDQVAAANRKLDDAIGAMLRDREPRSFQAA